MHQETRMTSQEAFDMLTGDAGVGLWNKFREEGGEAPSLAGLDFTGANLNRVNFRDVDRQGANLEAAQLTGADLTRANLQTALLKNATLNSAILKRRQLDRSRTLFGTSSTSGL